MGSLFLDHENLDSKKLGARKIHTGMIMAIHIQLAIHIHSFRNAIVVELI